MFSNTQSIKVGPITIKNGVSESSVQIRQLREEIDNGLKLLGTNNTRIY